MDFKVYYNNNKASIFASIKSEYVDTFVEKSGDDTKIIDMVFVIDKSGSMNDGFKDKPQVHSPGNFFGFNKNHQSKSSTVVSALSQSVDYLKILSKNNHKIRLTVIGFDEECHMLLDKVIVEDTPVFNIAFNSIKYKLHPDGGTDIYKTLKFTKNHVDELLETNTIENVNIFVMTDGYNNNTKENGSMIEFFKSIPYKHRFVGMGIGNVTDYDNELLDRLFDKLKGSPSANELSDNISSDTFGACSSVLSDFNITFSDYEGSKFYSQVDVKVNEEDKTMTFSSDRIDFSQKLIFSFENEEGFKTPIKMKVSYKNLLEKTDVSFEQELSSGETNDDNNSKIHTLCSVVSDFKNIFKSVYSQKENKEKTQTLLDKLSEWKKEDRTGDFSELGELWTANEDIITNHKKELEKYVDQTSYTAYTRVCSKQAQTTLSVGLTPSLSRTASNTVQAKYSTPSGGGHQQHNQHSAQIPEEIDFDNVIGVSAPVLSSPKYPWNSPSLKLTRQPACSSGLEEIGLGPSVSGALSTLPEETYTSTSTISSLAANLNTFVPTPPSKSFNLRSGTSHPYGKEEDSNDYKNSSLNI